MSQPTEISPKTAKQLQNFPAFLKEDTAFQESIETLSYNLYVEEVNHVPAEVGEAISKGILKPENGAFLPYSYWFHLSEQYDRGKSDDKKLLNPYHKDYEWYRKSADFIAWYYTQTIVLPLPGFDLAKEFKGSDGTFSMSVIRSLQGLPLYIPLKNKKYAGVLISFQGCLASETPELWKLICNEKSATDSTYAYSIYFHLLAHLADNQVSFVCPAYETFVNKEEMEAKKWDVQKDLSWVKETLPSVDSNDIKVCLLAMQASLFLLRHLPSSNWLMERKKIRLETDPVDGTVEAFPPDTASIYGLAKEGAFLLPNVDLTIEVEEDY